VDRYGFVGVPTALRGLEVWKKKKKKEKKKGKGKE
jgi:hypothetical protein